MLMVWVAILAAVVVGQHHRADSIRTETWSTGVDSATEEEIDWHSEPLAWITGVSAAFFFGSKWLIPEKGSRSIIRAWGLFAALIAVLYIVAFWSWFWF